MMINSRPNNNKRGRPSKSINNAKVRETMRERNTRLAGCVDCLNIVRNLLRQALHYITPTSINIYHEKEKKKEVRSGRCGDLFPRERKEKNRRKKELHCYTSYFFFGGYMCVCTSRSQLGSMKYLFSLGQSRNRFFIISISIDIVLCMLIRRVVFFQLKILRRQSSSMVQESRFIVF